MTSKETAIRNIQKLPDSLTWANIIEDRMRFLSAIDKGMDDTKSNKPLQYEDIKECLKQ